MCLCGGTIGSSRKRVNPKICSPPFLQPRKSSPAVPPRPRLCAVAFSSARFPLPSPGPFLAPGMTVRERSHARRRPLHRRTVVTLASPLEAPRFALGGRLRRHDERHRRVQRLPPPGSIGVECPPDNEGRVVQLLRLRRALPLGSPSPLAVTLAGNPAHLAAELPESLRLRCAQETPASSGVPAASPTFAPESPPAGERSPRPSDPSP